MLEDDADSSPADDDGADELLDERSPLDGLELLGDVRATLARVERLLVIEAHRSWACTWEEIGEALGISRQAAHRRHAASTRRAGSDPARRADERTWF